MITSAGATRLEVLQTPAPAEEGVSVTAGQSALALPLIRNEIVPVGAAGVTEGPTWAVKVTNVPTATETPGDAVTVRVEATCETVCVTVEATTPA